MYIATKKQSESKLPIVYKSHTDFASYLYKCPSCNKRRYIGNLTETLTCKCGHEINNYINASIYSNIVAIPHKVFLFLDKDRVKISILVKFYASSGEIKELHDEIIKNLQDEGPSHKNLQKKTKIKLDKEVYQAQFWSIVFKLDTGLSYWLPPKALNGDKVINFCHSGPGFRSFKNISMIANRSDKVIDTFYKCVKKLDPDILHQAYMHMYNYKLNKFGDRVDMLTRTIDGILDLALTNKYPMLPANLSSVLMTLIKQENYCNIEPLMWKSLSKRVKKLVTKYKQQMLPEHLWQEFNDVPKSIRKKIMNQSTGIIRPKKDLSFIGEDYFSDKTFSFKVLARYYEIREFVSDINNINTLLEHVGSGSVFGSNSELFNYIKALKGETIAVSKFKNRPSLYHDSNRMYLKILEKNSNYRPNIKGNMKDIHDNLSYDHDLMTLDFYDIPTTEELEKLEDNINGYNFIFPTNTKDLRLLGRKMNICVFSYANRAVNGKCHIYHMTGPNNSSICLELSESKELVQSKSFSNKRPDLDEQNVIKLWCKKHHISIRTRDMMSDEEIRQQHQDMAF